MAAKPHLTDDELERAADRILASVEGILDRNQRSYAIARKLGRFSTADLIEIFAIIMRRARLKEPRFQDGFRTISDIKRLGRHLGVTRMAEMLIVAEENGRTEVVRLLKHIPPARCLGPEEEMEEDPMLREMTLGTKRAKARLRDRDLINRLCNDQDPTVIEHLLRNPIITLREVVKIASKRPTGTAALWAVYRDLRWTNHYIVKKTLINNPYTPTQISLSLLHFLLEQDLEDVVDNMLLHEMVREQAVELIQIKRNAEQYEKPIPGDPGAPCGAAPESTKGNEPPTAAEGPEVPDAAPPDKNPDPPDDTEDLT